MSVEALLRSLEREGRTRTEAIRSEADAKLARIRADADDARVRTLSSALRDAEAALRLELGEQLAEARSQAQQRVLVARQTLLDRIFDEVLGHLAEALDDPAAHATLVTRAESALRHMPAGPVEIRSPDAVASVLGQALSGREDLRIEIDEDVAPGFRVIGANGALEVDATLETLLEIHRPALSIDVLQHMDGEPAK
jgi:vacuolar-type H+-ATPase subunit E/Vma4